MLKIVLGILFLVAVAMLIYAMVAWRDEVKDLPSEEPDDDYCKDMDQHL
jgi:hypothetical protein